jgi:hypothetical protein
MFRPFMRRRSRRSKNSLRSVSSNAVQTSRLTLEPIEHRILLSAEISVFNGAAEIVDGSTVAIDFGTVTQGAVGLTRTFTIDNDGDEPLTLGAISLPAGFSLVEGTASTIAVRGSETFTVRLDTTVTGVKNGFISFSNNDDDENPFDFAITGNVVVGAPEISVLDGATSLIDGSSTVIDFGSVVQGQPGPSRSFTVRNDGTLPLTVSGISLPDGFIVTDNLATSLLPGLSDTFSVQLSTAAAVVRSGEISITTNDADENPFNFRVAGTVTAFAVPDVAVLDGLTSIVDGSAVAVSLGTGFLGQDPPTRTFTIRNDGNATLTLGALTVPAGFTLLEGLPSTLSPRATDSFTVQLNTTALGTPSGQISFTNSDPDENPFNFQISGTVAVAVPEIRVFREDLIELVDGGPLVSVFDPTGVGQTGGTWAFSVVNVGTGTMTLGPITVPAGFTLVEGVTATLRPGESDVFTVRLKTTTAGDKLGDILVASNDADENPFNIPISGTVLDAVPEITVKLGGTDIIDGTTTAIDFGNGVQRDPGPRRTFTVKNTGTAPLALGPITLPTGYTVIEGLPPTLPARASDSFTVLLRTDAAGTFAGDITIVNNDPDENPFSFAISARVTPQPVPEIVVFDGTAPLTSGASAVIDFGTVTRRQRGPTRTFTIRNDGSDNLRLNRIDLPPGFSLVRDSRRTLHPRGSDTFVVRLDSKQLGIKSGQIRILNDDSDESVFTIAITGTVVP